MNSESIDWLLEHSAAAYEAEFKATEQLRDRISFVLSVAIMPYAGIAIYLASKFKGNLLQLQDFLLFSLPVLIAIALLIVAASFIAYTLVGVYGYSNIPRPAALLPYLRDHPEADKALEEAKINLIEQYADNIEHNFELNQTRARRLRIAQRLAAASLLALAVSVPRFVYSSMKAQAEPQLVKIAQPITITEEKYMPNNVKQGSQSGNQGQAQGQSQQPATNPSKSNPVATPPRPPFPKSQIIFEHLVDEPPAKKTR